MATDTRSTVVVGAIAIAIGIVVGMLMPWRRICPAPAPAPVETPPES